MEYIIEINIMCFCVLIGILYQYKKSRNREMKCLIFSNLIICMLLCILENIGSQILESSGYVKSLELNYFINFAYFVFSSLGMYSWFTYCELSIDTRWIQRKRYRMLAMIPALIIIFLSVLSYKNGWLFSFNANNLYVRGSHFIIHAGVLLLYPLVACIHAIIKSIRTMDYIKKKEYTVLSFFIVVPIFLGIIQFFYSSLPTINPAITLGILYIYGQSRNLRISTDYLTGINNRNSLMIYLSKKIKSNSDKKLFLYMLDIDYFKNINDGYGHIEGDNALTIVANALKNTAASTGCFVSRYGGDEFTIVYDADSVTDAKKLVTILKDNLADLSKDLPYKLALSVGMSENKSNTNIQKLFKQADSELYKVKKARK